MRDVDAERQHRQLQEPSRADAGVELRVIQGRVRVVRRAESAKMAMPARPMFRGEEIGIRSSSVPAASRSP
jgi:hypothetical protein